MTFGVFLDGFNGSGGSDGSIFSAVDFLFSFLVDVNVVAICVDRVVVLVVERSIGRVVERVIDRAIDLVDLVIDRAERGCSESSDDLVDENEPVRAYFFTHSLYTTSYSFIRRSYSSLVSFNVILAFL